MRKFIILCVFFLLCFSVQAMAAGLTPRNLDSFTEDLAIDYSQAAQLPLTGYFTKTVSEGRTMKIYLAPEASIRTYFTVVAVPNSADTQAFLDSAGWFDLIDKKGEGLVVLEPGANGWGSAQSEADYVNAAMGVVRSGRNSNGVAVLSSFGEFYLVGYGAGAAPLEYWAASNPILVISQAYIDGTSEQAALTEAGAPLYDGSNTSGYDPGLTDEADFLATLSRTGIAQTAKKDVPIPTWLVGYDADSVSGTYWRNANDCVSSPSDGVYWQKRDSARPQTLYATSQLTGSNGFSQVKFSDGATPNAEELYTWLANYTRYDVTFSYSNALAYRLDYTSAKVRAQQIAADGITAKSFTGTDWKGRSQDVYVLGQDSVKISGHGTVQFGIFSFSDNNGDGVNDPREYLLYIPDGFSNQALPVLFVYPGNTQTDIIFFDSTQWYQVADKEGIVLVFVCETYGSPISVTHVDSYLYQTAMMTILRNDINGRLASLDFTRVYATGQSLGSMTTQDMARVNPDFFAAMGSTSGVTYAVDDLTFGTDASSDKPIPTMLLIGQSDLPGLMPDLSSEALTKWGNYFLNANGLDETIGAKADNFGADSYSFLGKRHDVYTWNKFGLIPVFSWGMTLLRPHNCYPSEMPILWDFMKHFSRGSDGTRYYSASAFKSSDTINLQTGTPVGGSSGSSGCNSAGLGFVSALCVGAVMGLRRR